MKALRKLLLFDSGSADDVGPDEIEFKLCDISDAPTKGMQLVKSEHADVLLIRENDRLYAVGAKCSHYNAPLEKGVYSKGLIRCPWHGACFNVKTGDIEDFPGFGNIPCYQVDTRQGKVYVRIRKDKIGQPRIPWCTSRKAMTSQTIIVVGGGAAGFQCVETLKAEKFDGRIILISADDVLPYDRTKLSKSLKSSADELLLMEAESYERTATEIYLGSKVIKIDPESKNVICEDDSKFRYDKLFLATGVVPRKYKVPGSELANIYYLRSVKDANSIVEGAPGKDVVIIGNSFIGMEIASFLSNKINKVSVKSVSVVGRSSTPFHSTLGEFVGSKVKSLFEVKGVKFYKGEVMRFIGEHELAGVELKDGTVIDATLCVVGIGSSTDSKYLDGSGIARNESGYVIVDHRMKTNIDCIYAGGDMTAFPLVSFDLPCVSIGHWQIAQYHGKTAALSMLCKKHNTGTVPFFWTSLFGKVIRFAGSNQEMDETIAKESSEQWKFVVYYLHKGIVKGICTVNYDPLAAAFATLYSNGVYLRKSDLTDNSEDWLNLLEQ